MAYCTRADVELIFGTTNVAKWADANNNANAGEITARVTWACARASNDIDDALRGSVYEIPFAEPPQTIVDLAAQLAGVRLYELPRGLIDGEDTQKAVAEQKADAMKQLQRIRNMQVLLDVEPDSESTPAAVDITPAAE